MLPRGVRRRSCSCQDCTLNQRPVVCCLMCIMTGHIILWKVVLAADHGQFPSLFLAVLVVDGVHTHSPAVKVGDGHLHWGIDIDLHWVVPSLPV